MGASSEADNGNLTAIGLGRQQVQRLRKHALGMIVSERRDGTGIVGTVRVPDPDGAMERRSVRQRAELALPRLEYFVNAEKGPFVECVRYAGR